MQFGSSCIGLIFNSWEPQDQDKVNEHPMNEHCVIITERHGDRPHNYVSNDEGGYGGIWGGGGIWGVLITIFRKKIHLQFTKLKDHVYILRR